MVRNHMPHKAEGRREPKPWATGLLKFSISLFMMILFYFFICGFFTPSMPRRCVGDRRLHARCALLVLLVLTVVAPGSLGYSVEKVDVNRFVLTRDNEAVELLLNSDMEGSRLLSMTA
jgi:hypothetical protein